MTILTVYFSYMITVTVKHLLSPMNYRRAVERSGSTFSMPFSNRSFLADPLSASQNKEFVFSFLFLEFLPRAEELMDHAPKHRRGESVTPSEWRRNRINFVFFSVLDYLILRGQLG
jgi:hypothetical protein